MANAPPRSTVTPQSPQYVHLGVPDILPHLLSSRQAGLGLGLRNHGSLGVTPRSITKAQPFTLPHSPAKHATSGASRHKVAQKARRATTRNAPLVAPSWKMSLGPARPLLSVHAPPHPGWSTAGVSKRVPSRVGG